MAARFRFCPLLFALLWLVAAGSAQAWWDAEWAIRKKITVDASSTGVPIQEPIGSAAVLLRLHDGNFQFTAAKEDASDLRFVAEDDKTLLPYHLERFDGLLNEAFVWVRLPEVKPGAKTVFWMYYGNTGGKAGRVEDAKGTYDPETVLVYHFSERTGAPQDSSGKGNHAAKPAAAVTGSLIAGGVHLDGKSPLTIPATDSLAWGEGAAITWSAWVKPGAPAPEAVLFSRRNESHALVIGFAAGRPYFELDGQRTTGAVPLVANTWHHLAFAAAGGKGTLFLDGDPVSSAALRLPALAGPLLLGGDTVAGIAGFAGELDEVQLAQAARPPGWVKLAAGAQGGGDAANKLLVLGEDEQTSSWFSGGYFGIIIKSLTLDGWVVIGLLGVMAALSWYVMVSKVRYLNGISRGNALFMHRWAAVASDLTVLDHGDAENVKSLGGHFDRADQRALRRSSVYRIYHLGVEEIRHRLAVDHSATVLSARSIQSIRARLDGGLVREKQKIDRLIVLLTICISGGPFLGLLGTVVGVMITFAAVAAAGDVNVNAIAPGIAAALLATVAGLAVAIPSLFGYNYILSRVKDATADMHVFIDEFVSRMAEFYSEPAERIAPRRASLEPASVT